jgi:hypothetical protein
MALLIVACVNEKDLGSGNPTPEDPLADLDVADDFNYTTSKSLQVQLEVPEFLLLSGVVDLMPVETFSKTWSCPHKPIVF